MKNLEALLKHLNLDNQEFLFQFQSHPNYPSALAFSDTLNFMGLNNDAYELEKDYWNELPNKFIGIFKGTFTLVKKEKNNKYLIYSDKVKAVSEIELFENTDSFVLLFEKEEQLSETSKISFGKAILGIIAFYSLYSIYFFSWYEALFNLFSAIGFYLSYEVFNQKFGQSAPVINNICGRGGSFSANSETGCGKLINRDKFKIYGLKISDFSLIYFVSTALLGLFFPYTSFCIGLLACIALSSVLYSLYIQIIIEKVFCRVCLLIIVTLVGQAVISVFFLLNQKFYLPVFGISMLVFGGAVILILSINKSLNSVKELRTANIKNLKFKRNYEIFKREILGENPVNFSENEIFHIGKRNAKIHISMVSNPYCGYCKDAHALLEKIYEKYSDDISIQIRFNYVQEYAEDNMKTLISFFLSAYKYRGEKEFSNNIREWFETKNILDIKNYGNIEEKDLLKLHQIGAENSILGLNFTPMFFLNGYQFPDKYERADIFYFIDELLEDEDIINEKN